MVLVFGLVTGAFLLLAGLATYHFAPRVGPNPIFGVRTGYSFASREVWDRSNRVGGKLIAWTSVAYMALSVVLYAAVDDVPAGIATLGVAIIATLALEMGWLVLYSRRLVRGNATAARTMSKASRWWFVAPVAAIYAGLAIAAVVYAPNLPSDLIATHFDSAGVPDGFSTRAQALITPLGIGGALLALHLFLAWLLGRSSFAASTSRLRLRFSPRVLMALVSASMAYGQLVLLYAALDIFSYNTRAGQHLLPIGLVIALTAVVAAALLGGFFYFIFMSNRKRSEAIGATKGGR